jgi:hypothetical protein
MPQRVFCFVVVLVLFFNGEIFSQKNSLIKNPAVNYNSIANFESENELLVNWGKDSNKVQGKVSPIFNANKFHSSLFALPKPVLLQSFYCNHIGFFCQKEWQIERITSIPFRFRLGSLDYVNYLEQKPNAGKPK